ncbi:hypothetical protein HN014_06070 [Aquimarina sp. TRL1]|uniref:hypothetical protein n=1 Tax=Aquimarina sp. (strain TRL1) TaxID=2736252 RepID=UPI00158BA280|nr:hypothetical protein [Aquimarina sp. TRL1]QKX04496.1 hypothetical protein HN014_06070 [Aquimarina sp. TRL1]
MKKIILTLGVFVVTLSLFSFSTIGDTSETISIDNLNEDVSERAIAAAEFVRDEKTFPDKFVSRRKTWTKEIQSSSEVLNNY